MNTTSDASKHIESRGKLANRFTGLGWLGFWIQAGLLVVPIVLLIYIFVIGRPESGYALGIDISNYISNGSLVILVFTTFWFFRYTRLGKRIEDPASSPPLMSVERTLWVGIWASCLGIAFSIILMFSSIWRIMFIMLATPQTGLQIAPALGENPAKSLSAIDAAALTVLLVILVAELVVLGLSLWLLYQTAKQSTDETQATT